MLQLTSDRHAFAQTGPGSEAGDGVPPRAAGAAEAEAASIRRPATQRMGFSDSPWPFPIAPLDHEATILIYWYIMIYLHMCIHNYSQIAIIFKVYRLRYLHLRKHAACWKCNSYLRKSMWSDRGSGGPISKKKCKKGGLKMPWSRKPCGETRVVLNFAFIKLDRHM
jgi:hypothetical protein